MSSRYLLGIDLGTTNSVVAYVDTAEQSAEIRVFEVPQVVAQGEVRSLPGLPSFLYFPTQAQRESGTFDLPWQRNPESIVGVAARDYGALVPGRQVSSAKSWLCQDAVDRMAEILPRDAEPPEPRISPVEASARCLLHLRSAWNHLMAAEGRTADARFENQEIVLTVPASFDEEARELTVEAARHGGVQHLTLLEEPLAAFYAWVAKHQGEIANHVADGDLVLICDIGGGTSDFSLVRAHVNGSDVQFERTAIGEHLLLGGENLDLALARRVEAKLNVRLTLRQRHALQVACLRAKEQLLAGESLERVPISILGSGHAVVGQTLTSELTREEVVELLDNGFLPLTRPNDLPYRTTHAGLHEMGLPYASDPAITKHLAAFLRNAAQSMRAAEGAMAYDSTVLSAKPDAVLFNGGFCIPAIARERILEAIGNWFDAGVSSWRPRVLPSAGLESAVAVGAAYYGQVRRGAGLRVKAGSARTYYIGTRDQNIAICVLPAGTDEGSTLSLAREFKALANRPVSFNLFSSTLRRDEHGAIAQLDLSEMHRHAPLVTLLRYGKRLEQMELAVRLSVNFTEIGTLELWCESVSSPHRWRLQFELRGAATAADKAGVAAASQPAGVEVPQENLAAASEMIRAAFSSGAMKAIDPGSLTGALEAAIGMKKESWPLAAVRNLADTLLEVSDGRRLSARHEVRWLNLFGYCMRPGFGERQDGTRITQARKIYQGGIAFRDNLQSQVDWLVAWRRLSGGLPAAQQGELRNYLGNLGVGKKKSGPRLNAQVEREGWRLLASLEHLSGATRAALGNDVLRKLKKEPTDSAWLWSLGRFGLRIPLYGSLTCVVPARTAEEWIVALLDLDEITAETASIIVQIGRRTEDRARDISEQVRGQAIERLKEAGLADDSPLNRLREFVLPDRGDIARTFGEPLPKGLHLESTADCLSPVSAISA